MVRRSRIRFVTEFLGGLLKHNYLQKNLTPKEYFTVKKQIIDDRTLMLDVSRELFAHPDRDVEVEGFGSLRLVELQELTGTDFPFILITPERKRKRLRCFVGCRFAANIEKTLEFNLRTVLDPWNADIRIEGTDLDAGDLLRKIVNQIKSSDLAIFDNRGTLQKPNVYIEAGIRHALNRPMIFCKYTGRSVGGIKTIPSTGTVPVDLRSLTRVQYKTYEELCREIYFRFPRFLQRNRLVF